MQYKPNAYLLLAHIANTARRYNGHPDGLLIGQCHLQSWTFYGLTERQYRTAKEILVKRKHIIIIQTNRTRQKSTTGTTTNSTLVQLLESTFWDINPETNDDRKDDRATTERRPSDDKQERIRKNKKEKEVTTTKPPPPKNADDDGGEKISFCFEVGEFENITADDMSSWKLTYPDVDVSLCIRQMQEWVMADPKARAKKQWKRFIVTWLGKNQERMSIAMKTTENKNPSRAYINGKRLTEYDTAW